MTLLLEIITPEKMILKDEVDEVIAPTVTGQIAILPHHISLITQISEGEVTLKKGAKEQHLAVTGGFMEVTKNKVTILADYAIRSDEIELSKAQEAKERAEKLMKEKTSERDFIQAETQFRRAILELKIGNRRRRTTPLPNQ